MKTLNGWHLFRRIGCGVALCSALLLAACGGGGGVSTPPAAPPPASGGGNDPPAPPPPPDDGGDEPPPVLDAPCASTTLTWRVQGLSCSAVAAASPSGATLLMQDTTTPTMGSASFTCSNASWVTQTAPASSCTVQAPPATDWQGAALVEELDASTATTPDVAIDAFGNAVAVWVQGVNTSAAVYGNRYTQGAGWGVPFVIDSPPLGASTPKVAVDASGNAVAVWLRNVDSTGVGTQLTQVWASRLPLNGTPNAPELLEPDTFKRASNLSLAMNASGQAVLVWRQLIVPIGVFGIRANYFTTTDGWSGAKTIATITTNQFVRLEEPMVSVDAQGNATAVFSSSDGGMGMVRSEGANWSSVDWTGFPNVSQPQISRLGQSHEATVWVHRDADGSSIAAMWSAPTDIGWGFDVLVFERHIADRPQVVMSPSGRIIAVWQQSDSPSSPTSIYASTIDVSINDDIPKWSPPQLLETSEAGNATDPQLAVDAAGNATVVWPQADGPAGAPTTRTSVWTNRYTPDGGWGTAQLLASTTDGDAGEPQLAVNPNGQAAAVWHQSTGTASAPGRRDIWGNTFR